MSEDKQVLKHFNLKTGGNGGRRDEVQYSSRYEESSSFSPCSTTGKSVQLEYTDYLELLTNKQLITQPKLNNTSYCQMHAI